MEDMEKTNKHLKELDEPDNFFSQFASSDFKSYFENTSTQLKKINKILP